MSVSAQPSHNTPPLIGCRILIVEDEYFLANDLERQFRALGAMVAGPLGKLDDAMDVVSDGGRLDGAVLDVNIRNELVFPLARALRVREVPFVFTSGYDKAILGAEFKEILHWEKPFDVVAVARGLARLIQLPRGE